LPSIAFDHIDDNRRQNCRVADDSDHGLFKALLAPDERPVSVSSDVGLTVENYAKMGCPAQFRVHETSKLRSIATSQRRCALFGRGCDFLLIRWHRPESRRRYGGHLRNVAQASLTG
jgi:hypothetical protein